MHSVCSAVKGRKGKEKRREREKGERERRTQMQTQGQETTDAGVQFEPRSKGTLTH